MHKNWNSTLPSLEGWWVSQNSIFSNYPIKKYSLTQIRINCVRMFRKKLIYEKSVFVSGSLNKTNKKKMKPRTRKTKSFMSNRLCLPIDFFNLHFVKSEDDWTIVKNDILFPLEENIILKPWIKSAKKL
jgi:hypothetical protein